MQNKRKTVYDTASPKLKAFIRGEPFKSTKKATISLPRYYALATITHMMNGYSVFFWTALKKTTAASKKMLYNDIIPGLEQDYYTIDELIYTKSQGKMHAFIDINLRGYYNEERTAEDSYQRFHTLEASVAADKPDYNRDYFKDIYRKWADLEARFPRG